jgi:CubicO group peptidase (beta-lactamase class C family)
VRRVRAGVKAVAPPYVGPRSAVAALIVLLFASAPAHAQQPDRARLVAALDSIARAHVEHPTVPGVSVAVVQAGDTLLKRGYGFVDLEWDVPTPVDAEVSYEIGSVTKQFTAAAVLLLAEEGDLDLDADLTAYVDFDTQGRAVPVRRLLDHTSGIRGYTEMPIFGEISVLDLPRDSLVTLVEREPFDFEPGRAQIYNNSAYFLLGLIIEKVSGQPYEDFVEDRLFGPAGMDDSYYCSESAVRARRAHGYDATGPESLDRAGYLDHTWPYAAGSLCSTVGDLVRWTYALHGGRILSDASYRTMTTPAPLEDGTPIRYAMGLGVDAPGGRRVVQHGGGINGFLSQLSWYPDEELTVAVLQNSAGPRGAGALAGALAERVLGPTPEPPAVAFGGDYGAITGTYRGAARGRMMELEAFVDDGRLALRINDVDGDPARPIYRGGNRWDLGGARITFVIDRDEAFEVRFDTGGGHYVLRRVEG